MLEEIETVVEHCKHDDCIYRSSIDGGATPICFYAVLAEQARGCKISECDKYQMGERLKPRMTKDCIIWWEYEIYDTDADFIW